MLFSLPIQDLTLPWLGFRRFDSFDHGDGFYTELVNAGRGDDAKKIRRYRDQFTIDGDTG